MGGKRGEIYIYPSSESNRGDKLNFFFGLLFKDKESV